VLALPKEQATFIEANKALMWNKVVVPPSVGFIQVHTKFNGGNKQMLM